YDFPCLGIDQNAIYVGCSIFSNASGRWANNSLFVIQKSSLYNSHVPVNITAFRDVTNVPGQFGFPNRAAGYRSPATLFPLDNFDANPEFGYAICQVLNEWSALQLYRIVNAGSTTPSLVGPFAVNVMQT